MLRVTDGIDRLMRTLRAPDVPAEPPVQLADDLVGRLGTGRRTTDETAAGVEPVPGAAVPASGGEAVREPAPDPPTGLPATATPAPTRPDGLDPDTVSRLEATSAIVEALGLGFHLGGAMERIAVGSTRGREGVQPLREATWLIERYVALVEDRPVGADLHATTQRLARSGDALAELRALVAELDTRPTPAPASAPVEEGAPDPEPAALPSPVPPRPEAISAAAPPPPPEQPSFAREVALMAVRWLIMVVAVVVVVLAVTLIGDWR